MIVMEEDAPSSIEGGRMRIDYGPQPWERGPTTQLEVSGACAEVRSACGFAGSEVKYLHIFEFVDECHCAY
jgi:hypothetical protein